MIHRVKDMSPQQRVAVESLIGRSLALDEGLNIHPTRILKEAPAIGEREQAAAELIATLDTIAAKAKAVPDDELEAAIQEACDHARRS